MALEKVVYEDKKTVISAKNLNDIQDAVKALEAKSNEIFSHRMETAGDSVPNLPELIAGKVYTVRWDGADYACMCRDGGGFTYLGSGCLVDDERIEPFLIYYIPGDENVIFSADGEAGHVVTISEGYPSYYRYMMLGLGTPVIEGDLAFNGAYMDFALDLSTLEIGKTYRVKWGASVYDCVMTGNPGFYYYLGNRALENGGEGNGTGEPFVFYQYGNTSGSTYTKLYNRVGKWLTNAETIPYGIYEKP